MYLKKIKFICMIFRNIEIWSFVTCFTASGSKFNIYQHCTYFMVILQYQKVQNNCHIVWKEEKKVSFQSFLIVSSITSVTVLLPFLTISVHASGTIKVISWTVTVLKFIKSMQYDCSNRTSAGWQKLKHSVIKYILKSTVTYQLHKVVQYLQTTRGEYSFCSSFIYSNTNFTKWKRS
jgi:hypothetical protein